MNVCRIKICVDCGATLKDAWTACRKLMSATGLNAHFEFNGVQCFFHGQSFEDLTKEFNEKISASIAELKELECQIGSQIVTDGVKFFAHAMANNTLRRGLTARDFYGQRSDVMLDMLLNAKEEKR